ncbi:MAG: class I SAM-dependent methyltransferase [Bacteroidota bacterium]
MKSKLPYLDKPSPWSSHSIIAAQLQALPDQSKVLDVGTASGTLARMCMEKPLHLFGVEPNADWAQIASPLYERIWIGSIDEIGKDCLAGYDAIILGDILEHLPNPEQVLQKLIEHQPEDCLFMISVPNIANLWVRLNLMIGRFDYADRGILDRTHLRFFTRKSLVAMVENAGLRILSIRATPIPLELISNFFNTSPGRFLYGLLARCTALMPTLLGYQYIVEARKR